MDAAWYYIGINPMQVFTLYKKFLDAASQHPVLVSQMLVSTRWHQGAVLDVSASGRPQKGTRQNPRQMQT
jgi:hypothetical protein